MAPVKVEGSCLLHRFTAHENSWKKKS